MKKKGVKADSSEGLLHSKLRARNYIRSVTAFVCLSVRPSVTKPHIHTHTHSHRRG